MALQFEQIYGQPGVLAELTRSFRAGSVVHAFLIHGEAGCGKRTLAMTLSMALHCEKKGGQPCMACGPCKRMLAGTHPDHIVVKNDKTIISVDEVRDLIDALSEKPYEGGFRTVVIEDADKLNDRAQNALLKTLEEPDGRTVFFLLTARKEALLPTIRSRCRPVFMPRLPEETVEQELLSRGVKPDRAAYAARLSQGVLGRALELAGEDPYYAARDEALALLNRLRGREDIPAVQSGWDDKRKSEDWLRLLDALETVLRDVMRVQAGLAPIDVVIEDDLSRLAERFTFSAVACIMEETVSVRKRLSAHVQWRSAAEPLLLKIVEDKYK
ncbi:MAG: DNA polymerase III subunit delta' [Candidatus Spyradocola sp.]